MTIFNTLQYDEATAAKMKTYEHVMGTFSRYEIQVIAKMNDVPFKWGVTPKKNIIDLMRAENVSIPTREQFQAMKEEYRKKELKEAANAAPKDGVKQEVVQDKAPVVENPFLGSDNQEDKPVSLEEMKRPELMAMAADAGIKETHKMTNENIKEALRGQDPSPNNE